MSTITKLMADAVAYNFKSLFEFDSFTHLASMVGDNKSDESKAATSQTAAAAAGPLELNTETIKRMHEFTSVAFMHLFHVKPQPLFTNRTDCSLNMPISMWLNCAYTIQVTGRNLSNSFIQYLLKQF